MRKKQKQPVVVFTTEPLATEVPNREKLALQRAGYDAALDGKHVLACPYRWNAGLPDEPVDHVRGQLWLAGYAAGRSALRVFRDGVPQATKDRYGTLGTI